MASNFSIDFLRKDVDGELKGIDPYRVGLLSVIVGPFLGTIFALLQLARGKKTFWGGVWDIILNLALLNGFYWPIAFGVTGGLHRLFTHSSYNPKPPVKVVIGILANMAIEGPPTSWCSDHREHHKYSDTERDLHSPMHDFWHAHIGWFFGRRKRDLHTYVPDLLADPIVQFLDRAFPYCVAASLALPWLIAGKRGFVWGGLVRIFFVHHATWCINSVFHIWGNQFFDSRDGSRSAPFTLIGWILRILGLGEPDHNAHHAFPRSPRHGFAWELLRGEEIPWWMDITYAIEKWMETQGWVELGKVPTPEQYRKKLRVAEPELVA